MSTSTIATSTFWQIGSQASMAALSILAAKFVAIGLSKELVGHYNSAYGFLQIFAVIADCGLYAVSVRELSRAKDPGRVLCALVVLRGSILLLSLGSAVAIAWLLPMWRGTPLPLSILIVALVPFFTLLAGILRTVFQTAYKMHYLFIAEVAQRLLTVSLIGYLVLAGTRGSTDLHTYHLFLFIGGVGAFLLFLLSAFYSNRLLHVRLEFDFTIVKRFALLAAPYGIAYLLMSLYRKLDVGFIALLRPDFALQNAYYGFASRVEELTFVMPTLLLNSVLPLLTMRIAKRHDTRSLLGRTLFLLLLASSTFFLFSLLWATPFTLMFATEAYLSTATHAGADRAFTLLSLPMALNGVVLFSFYVFLANHAWKRLIVSFGIGVILSVVLNLLWTPSHGFVGAGSALVAVQFTLTAILLPQTLRLAPMHFTLHAFIQWIAYTVILGSILLLTAPLLTSGGRTFVGGSIMIVVIGVLALALGIHRTLSKTTE